MKEEKTLVNGLSVNYKIAGDGFPFLILHGWGGSSNSWIEVLKIISLKRYRVIALDLPGFGKSSSPPVPWGINDYVDFVQRFTDKLNFQKMILLGHSFGGRVSIRFATKHPERLKTLILCAAAGIKLPYTFTQVVIFYIARVGNFLLSPRPLRRIKDWIKNNFYMLIRQHDYQKAKGTMRDVFKKTVIDDQTPELKDIKTKTLIVWGERDTIVPIRAASILKEKIPDSTLEFVPRASHSPNLETPEKLSEIILNFLEKN